MNKRNKELDCIKGICCIAVVLIHYNFPGDLGIAIKTVARFAVPIFFATSGFFFGLPSSDSSYNVTRCVRKIKHIFRILLLSSMFYACFDVIWNLLMYESWSLSAYIAEKVTIGKICKLFLTNDPLVYSHLWFLMALIYCYILGLLCKGSYPKILIRTFPALLVGFFSFALWKNVLGIAASIPLEIGGSKFTIMKFNFFFFRALPWFLMGMYFKEKEIWIKNKNIDKYKLQFLLLMGSAWSLFERLIFLESQFYIGTLFVVISLLIYAITYPDKGNESLAFVGRNLSLYMYILHIAVGKSLDLFASKYDFWSSNLFLFNRAFLIITLTLLFSYLLFILNDKIKKSGK